jgi:hypothetical protein
MGIMCRETEEANLLPHMYETNHKLTPEFNVQFL